MLRLYGYLEGVDTIESLRHRFKERLYKFKRYINLNIDEIPEEISNSKTVINEPISKMASLLRETKLIGHETHVFVRIDQYEQLSTLNFPNQRFGQKCATLIHKALAARDPSVSYQLACDIMPGLTSLVFLEQLIH